MSDLDIDFWSIIYTTWTGEEIDGWSAYARRVERRETAVKF